MFQFVIRTFFTVFLVGALTCQPASGQPAQAESDADVRCVVFAVSPLNSSDADMRSAGQGLFLYYLGRIDGRDPHFDLEAAVLKATHDAPGNAASAQNKQCAETMRARSKEVAAIGQKLQAIADDEKRSKTVK
jgi:hypothetical protein